MRRWGLALLLAGCFTAVPDSPDAAACNEFLDQGYCYPRSAPCFEDLDCPAGAHCALDVSRCRPTRCGCMSAADCPSGAVCITNEAVCGVCEPMQPTCAAGGGCRAGSVCRGGRCEEQCCGW